MQNNKYKKAQGFNTWTERHIAGFDNIVEYGPGDIDSEFSILMKSLISQANGN